MTPKGVKDSIDENTYKIGDILSTFNTMSDAWILCDGNNKTVPSEIKNSILYPSLYTASFSTYSPTYYSVENATLYDQKTFDNPIYIYHSDDRNNTDREIVGVYQIKTLKHTSVNTNWRNLNIVSAAYGDGIAFICVNDHYSTTKLYKYVYSNNTLSELSTSISYTNRATNYSPYAGWWYNNNWYIIAGDPTSGLCINVLDRDGSIINSHIYTNFNQHNDLIKIDHYVIYLSQSSSKYMDLDNFGDFVEEKVPINFTKPTLNNTYTNMAISKDFKFYVAPLTITSTYVTVRIYDMDSGKSRDVQCFDQTGGLTDTSEMYFNVFIDSDDIIHAHVTNGKTKKGLYALLKKDSKFGLLNTISYSSYTNKDICPQNAIYAYPFFKGDNLIIYFNGIYDTMIKSPSIVTNNLKITYMKVKN